MVGLAAATGFFTVLSGVAFTLAALGFAAFSFTGAALAASVLGCSAFDLASFD